MGRRQVLEFLAREDGPTAVEYAVILSLILVACVAAVATFGQKSSAVFDRVGHTLGAS